MARRTARRCAGSTAPTTRLRGTVEVRSPGYRRALCVARSVLKSEDSSSAANPAWSKPIPAGRQRDARLRLAAVLDHEGVHVSQTLVWIVQDQAHLVVRGRLE